VLAMMGIFANAQISVNSNGDVTIGGNIDFIRSSGYITVLPNVSNSYLGNPYQQFTQIRGVSIYGNGTYWGSDERTKENFRKIESPLEKVLTMNGKKYDFIINDNDLKGTPEEAERNRLIKKDRIGFVAQELMQVAPEAVLYEKEEDKYYIEY
jgi:hypothetical protein